ncbi:MAG: polysaccharide deacetylase family protein, partial [Rubrivivax sp.]|nr:polysaccharide deacetylase family protein [Rubrivivax sp.]
TLRFAWHERQWDFATDNLPQRETAFAKLARLVRAQPRSQRDALVTRLCAAGGVDPLTCTRELIMDWDELRAVAADPLVTIGAHSTAHHSLNRLTAEEVRDELLDAKHQLEARLGRQTQHLAYPFGGRNAIGSREFALAAQCGFLTAMTTLSANLFRGHARHLHALPRLVVSGNYPVQRLAWMDSGLIPAKTFHGRRIVAG